jgi:hypothetical protein
MRPWRWRRGSGDSFQFGMNSRGAAHGLAAALSGGARLMRTWRWRRVRGDSFQFGMNSRGAARGLAAALLEV